jgi:hypothetical protein
MVQDQSNNSADSGNVQNGSEGFRTIPKASESFGKVRNDSARFGNVPHDSERRENHSLTIRESAKLFEAAGVARTERSITNWCWPNRQGVARLDSYFDPNERRYYITPESVEMAIAEEKARAAKLNESSEPVGSVPKGSEKFSERVVSPSDDDLERVKELEKKVFNLEILNQGKDFFVEQLKKERNTFFDQLLAASRQVGELETKLRQIEAAKPS